MECRDEKRGRVKKKKKEEDERETGGREKSGLLMLVFSGQVREWRAVSQAASRQHVGQ